MSKWFVLILILVPFCISAQKINKKAIDPKKQNEMLIGYCSREGFKTINSNFDSCYRMEYPAYTTNPILLKQLKPLLKNVKITLVLATWCGDSKEWVPRFYKILDEVGYKMKNLTVIAVDRSRSAPDTPVNKLDIQRVPTFIFYRNKTEIGRIIETPEGLLEQNMINILNTK